MKLRDSPRLPVPTILPGTLGAAEGCWTQVVAPGLAQTWLCTGRTVRAARGSPNPSVSQDPIPPLLIAHTFWVQDPCL